MKEKLTYLSPVCEVLQTEVLSDFLVTSNGIDPWQNGNQDPFNF